MARKIVQIAAIPDTGDRYETLCALADDGTLWAMALRMGPLDEMVWDRVPGLPQGDEDLTTEE